MISSDCTPMYTARLTAICERSPARAPSVEVAAEEQPPDGDSGGGSRGPLAAPLLDGDPEPRDAPP